MADHFMGYASVRNKLDRNASMFQCRFMFQRLDVANNFCSAARFDPIFGLVGTSNCPFDQQLHVGGVGDNFKTGLYDTNFNSPWEK